MNEPTLFSIAHLENAIIVSYILLYAVFTTNAIDVIGITD